METVVCRKRQGIEIADARGRSGMAYRAVGEPVEDSGDLCEAVEIGQRRQEQRKGGFGFAPNDHVNPGESLQDQGFHTEWSDPAQENSLFGMEPLETFRHEEREGKQVGHAGKAHNPCCFADVAERRVKVEWVRGGPYPGQDLVIDEVDGATFLLEHGGQVQEPQRGVGLVIDPALKADVEQVHVDQGDVGFCTQARPAPRGACRSCGRPVFPAPRPGPDNGDAAAIVIHVPVFLTPSIFLPAHAGNRRRSPGFESFFDLGSCFVD